MTRSGLNLAVLAAFVLVLVVVPAAFAGKGGKGANSGGGGNVGSSTSSLALRMVTDVNGNGSPNWGDTVTFDASGTPTNSWQVSLNCYQGGVLVYRANAAWYDGNPFSYMQYMKLQSGAWTGGAADCSAVLYYTSGRKTVNLATLSFHVDA
jgi:hypothetical protein